MPVRNKESNSRPFVAAFTTLGVLIIYALLIGVVAITGHLDATSTPLIVGFGLMIGPMVPATVGALNAEKTRKMVQNGTIVEKSRQGFHKALEDIRLTNEGREPGDVDADG